MISSLQRKIQHVLPNAEMDIVTLPDVPEIKLEILERDCFRRPLTDAEMDAAWGNPPYWAFCWASGQAMARWVLDHADSFRGKTVIDFGAGSGVVAVAAALAGARVIACDLDSDALDAVARNADLNHVDIACVEGLEQCAKADILLAADVLYDLENLALLDLFLSFAERVYVADSRIRNFDHPQYCKVDEIDAVTLPDLDELELYRRVSFYSSI